MSRRAGFVALPVLVLCTDCTTTVPADIDVGAIVTRNTQTNTEIFAEEGTGTDTNITRYICKQSVIEALQPDESLDDAETVRAKCKADRPVVRTTFEAAWKAAYLGSENLRILGVASTSGELNEQENVALSLLAAELGWRSTVSDVADQEVSAVETAKAVFYNSMDVAYDAALRAEIPDEEKKGATVMAGAVRVTLGSFKLPDSKVTKATTFRVAAETASPVDYVQLTLTPARCATIKSVVGVATDGTTSIESTRTTRTGHRFAFAKRNSALASIAITAVKIKSSAESGHSCNIKLTGGAVPAPVVQATSNEERDRTMKAFMGQRNHRIWHYLWHGIRGSWLRMSTSQRTRVSTALGTQWARPQEPARAAAASRGEEFLHMHRAMLGMLRDLLGNSMYEPWTTIPADDDAAFPVPMENRDAETYAQIKKWETQSKDTAFLASKTLGEYGVWLEENLHNNLHMYWSDPATGDKYGPLEPPTIFDQGSADADAPANDYLGSTYSSHVNPIFYRIHGFVNARIEDWLHANGYTSVGDADTCVAPACYKWKGVWDGPLPHRVESDTTVATAMGPTPDPSQLKAVAEDPSLARLVHNNANLNPIEAPAATEE